MSAPILHTCAIPTVNVFLERSRGGPFWCWVVRRCENCGHGHVHGGGPITEDPRGALGHRVAHCREHPRGGYMLMDADPGRTERILAEVQ